LRFQGAKSACPCKTEPCVGDVEGSARVQGPERRAKQRARQRAKIGQMDLPRPFEGGFEEGDRGFVFPVKSTSVAKQRLMPGQSKLEADAVCMLDGRPQYRRRQIRVAAK